MSRGLILEPLRLTYILISETHIVQPRPDAFCRASEGSKTGLNSHASTTANNNRIRTSDPILAGLSTQKN